MLQKLKYWKRDPKVEKKDIEFMRKHNLQLSDDERIDHLKQMEMIEYLWEIFNNIKLIKDPLTRKTWLKSFKIQLKCLFREIAIEQSCKSKQEIQIIDNILSHL